MNKEEPINDDFNPTDLGERPYLPYILRPSPLEKLSLADLVALRNMGYATVQKEIDKRIKEIFG